ncbi:hypothetical protein K3495_g10074 [Podosphaera aphanis]|nr:hypothetical protein K3495_g10074 [Podosphaera aphanis]
MNSLILLSAALSATLAAPSTDYTSNSRYAKVALQDWYNATTGLWETTGWWNSANCMTTIGAQAIVDPQTRYEASNLFQNTFSKAPQYNEGAVKMISADYMIYTFHRGISTWPRRDPQGFLNAFYDDEGWWALGWIQAYDVTARLDYLMTAMDIFNDMKNATTTPCGGGIWWDRSHSYVNAIANELYLSVAAHLANRAPFMQRKTYRQIAIEQWEWFERSGMINPDYTISDGLTSSCASNNGTVWTYNQGVILGGLVELSRATSNSSYLIPAQNIALAAITNLTDSKGVFHDVCEPDCGNDGSQFKGILMRNLRALQTAAPNNKVLSSLAANAVSIWKHNRNEDNQFSVNWAGPFAAPANASTHSSAMDAIVAASAFQQPLKQGIQSR